MASRTPETHAVELTTAFKKDSEAKYRRGQREHGGELWNKRVIEMLGEEIVDQWSYYHVFLEQWTRVEQLLGELVDEYAAFPRGVPAPEKLVRALNIVRTGNEQGDTIVDEVAGEQAQADG